MVAKAHFTDEASRLGRPGAQSARPGTLRRCVDAGTIDTNAEEQSTDILCESGLYTQSQQWSALPAFLQYMTPCNTGWLQCCNTADHMSSGAKTRQCLIENQSNLDFFRQTRETAVQSNVTQTAELARERCFQEGNSAEILDLNTSGSDSHWAGHVLRRSTSQCARAPQSGAETQHMARPM